MKTSRKAQRKWRHYRRMHQKSGLNLVSLMDIFTILVFFLMVNSSEVQVLAQNKEVKLPESTADRIPEETVVIVITRDDVVVQGKAVARVANMADEKALGNLRTELQYLAKRDHVKVDPKTGQGGHITIMGEKSLPYSVLKAVMNTCVNAQFTEISLAVNKHAAKEV